MDSQQKFYMDEEYFLNRAEKQPESENVIKLLKEIEQLKFYEQIELRKFFNIALRDRNIF